MENQQPEALILVDDRPSAIGDDLYQWALDALVPGVNFHVIFADDADAIKHHHEMAEKIQKRIDRKAAAKEHK